MSKTAIVVFSDPRSGSEEARGRLFNGLFVAYEKKRKGQEVAVIFQGTGTRWVSEIVKPDHPANPIYQAISDKVVGACGGCADAFGASDDVEQTEVPLIREFDIPGTLGVIDLSKYLDDGYTLLTF